MDSLFAEPDLVAPNAVEEALGGPKVGHVSVIRTTTRTDWEPRFPAASIPAEGSRPRLNPHSRGDPRGSVQSIVSEVPTRPFVRATCCRRHFGYNPLH